VADIAVVAAQQGRARAGGGLGGQGCGLRLDHGHRVAIARRAVSAGTLTANLAFAGLGGDRALFANRSVVTGRTILARALVTGAIIPGTVIAEAVFTRTLVPRPIITRTVVTRSVVARTVIPGAVVARTIIARAIIPGTVIPWAIITGAVITVTPAVAAALLTLLTLLALALTVEAVAGTIVALTIFTGPVIARSIIALAILEPVAAAFTLLSVALARGLGRGLRLGGVGLLGLGLEVDLVGRIGVLADDVADRSIRLDGAQDPEIVLGVLQIVLGQDPVAGRRRVAGQLLVFFIDALGRATNLDAVGTVRIEGPVGVMLLRLAATAAAAAIVAAALALHALEISHLLF
jgi:hypothetical protein